MCVTPKIKIKKKNDKLVHVLTSRAHFVTWQCLSNWIVLFFKLSVSRYCFPNRVKHCLLNSVCSIHMIFAFVENRANNMNRRILIHFYLHSLWLNIHSDSVEGFRQNRIFFQLNSEWMNVRWIMEARIMNHPIIIWQSKWRN